MTMPDKVEVNDETKDVLGALAQGDPDLLAAGLELRANWKAKSGLDGRSYALVKLAALIALDAPPASYVWQVGNALSGGVMPDDILGTLHAVVPQVGLPRATAGARGCMLAMGMAASEADLVRAHRDH